MLKAVKINEKKVTEQELFIGLDVHEKSWNISVLGKDNEYIRGMTVVPNAKSLKGLLDRKFSYNELILAYEAGFCGFSIQRSLSKEGIETIVVNPADIPTRDKDSKQKTDSNDSLKIAKALRGDLLEGIYVPTEKEEDDQSLIRYRDSLVDKQTRTKLQIKSYLKKYGINIPGSNKWGESFKARIIASVKEQRPGILFVMKGLIEDLNTIELRIKETEVELEKLVKKSEHYESYRRLTGVPGIGKIVSLALIFEIYNIDRFESSRHFSSYVGLIPTENSSGEKVRKGRMTKRGHRRLKRMVIEASWIAVRRDEAFSNYYKKQIGRSKKAPQAIVKCAKKLLSRIYHILKSGEDYKVNFAA